MNKSELTQKILRTFLETIVRVPECDKYVMSGMNFDDYVEECIGDSEEYETREAVIEAVVREMGQEYLNHALSFFAELLYYGDEFHTEIIHALQEVDGTKIIYPLMVDDLDHKSTVSLVFGEIHFSEAEMFYHQSPRARGQFLNENADNIYAIDGWYTSSDGTEWNDLDEVYHPTVQVREELIIRNPVEC